MAFGAVVLRVLLCVGLLVSSSAQAIAMTHIAGRVHEMASTAPPCHDAAESRAAQAHSPVVHGAANPTSMKPDCCKSGVCDCACSHGAVTTSLRFDGEGRRVADLTQVGRLAGRHASPALPRLIRPPIA